MGLVPAITLVALGAFTLLAQTVLLREHLVSCGGGELAVGLFFTSWFGWIALGATLRRRLPLDRWQPTRWLLVLIACYPPAAAIQWLALRSLRWMAGVAVGDPFPMADLAWTTAVACAPVALVTGLAFPAACAMVADRSPAAAADRVTTWSYVLEAVGAFAGGGAATLLVLAGAPPTAILAVGVIGLAAAGLALGAGRGRDPVLLPIAAALVAGIAGVAAQGERAPTRGADRFLLERQLPTVEFLDSVETPYQRLNLGRSGDQLLVLGGGEVRAALPDPEGDVPTAALLIAQRPDANRVLVVGQGSLGLVAEILAHGPPRVVHLQPDRAAVEAIDAHLPAGLAESLASPALERRHGDPRREVEEARARGETFDLVILDRDDPITAASNRLATREFLEQCRALLTDGGLLAARVGATVNYQGRQVRRYAASALWTTEQVFDQVAWIPGETSWLLAGAPGGPSADPDELARRYGTLPPERQAVPAATFASLVDPRRAEHALAAYRGELDDGGDRLLNTDAAPVAFLLQLGVLAHTRGSWVAGALEAAHRGGGWLIVLPLLVAAAVRVRRDLLWPDPGGEGRRAGALVLGTAGAAAIALQVCLILSFQVRFGDLFAQVGWLNALFMGGLAAGGLAGGRWIRGRGLAPALVFCGLATTLCLVAGRAIPWLQASPHGASGPLYFTLIAAGGLVFGAGFPVAGSLVAGQGARAGAVGAILEAADHWGAALGAALVGVLLVPVIGPARTADLLALVLVGVGTTLALPAGLRRLAVPGSAPARALGALERAGRRRPRAGRRVAGWRGGVVLAAVAVSAAVRAGDEGPRVRFDDAELAGMGGELGLVERERPFVHYRGLDPDGLATGDAVCGSRAVTDEIHGYGGPLDLLVSFTPEGTIRELRLVESRETPAYLVGFDDWLRQLRGLPLDAPIDAEGGRPIEGLTGATVTSTAALATVARVRQEVATGILDLPAPPASAPPASPWARLPALLLGVLLLAAVPTLLSGRRSLRVALLALSAAVAGLWLNQQLSLEHLASLARLELPSPANSEGWLLVGGAALLGVAFGPAYCGVLCPFGAVQELLAGLGWTTRPGARVERAARGIKYGLLAVALVLFLASGARAWLGFDPLATRLGLRAAGPLLALVVLSLGASLRYRRFWCRFLCPVGAALSTTNRLALLRRWLPGRRHDRCDLGVAGEGDWDCIQCNRCTWAAAPAPDRPPEHETRRRSADRWLAILLALALALAAMACLAARPVDLPSASGTRPVDVDRIREQIESRQLSDHPAEFWEAQ